MQGVIESTISNLFNKNQHISAVTIMSASNNSILYQTSNWDISHDIPKILTTWTSQGSSLSVQGINYMALQNTPERLVCTNIKKQGHIIVSKAGKVIAVAYFLPDADLGGSYTDLAHAVLTINQNVGKQL